MKVYVVVMLNYKNDDKFSFEPVGVYSHPHKAFEWIKKLENKSDYIYDIFEYNIDGKPLLLDLIEGQEERFNNLIKNSMDKGLIDQLIGEDGRFYYQLTDLGKKTASRELRKLMRYIE